MTDPIPFPMFYHFHPVTPRRQAFWRDTLLKSCLNEHIWPSPWNRDKLIDTLCKPEATELMVLWGCSMHILPGYLRALRVRPQTTVAIVGGVTFTVFKHWRQSERGRFHNQEFYTEDEPWLGGDTLAVLLSTLQTDVTIRIITQCRNVTASALWNINPKLFYYYYYYF